MGAYQLISLSQKQFILPKKHLEFEKLHAWLTRFCVVKNEMPDYQQYEFSKEVVWQKVYEGQNPLEGIELLEKNLASPLSELRKLTEENIAKAGELLASYLSAQATFFLKFTPWDFPVRKGQKEAFQTICSLKGHSGLIVLPGGYGKTRLGYMLFGACREKAFIVAPSDIILAQWVEQWQSLLKERIEQKKQSSYWEYSSQRDEKRIFYGCTYKEMEKAPLELAKMILLDEAHHLESKHLDKLESISSPKWGLTATPVFKYPEQTFKTIGPILYRYSKQPDQSLISLKAYEIFLPMAPKTRRAYFLAKTSLQRQRIAGLEPQKDVIIEALLKKHRQDQVIVIAEYLENLRRLKETLKLQLLDGTQGPTNRKKAYEMFNQGKSKVLLTSRVSEEGIDFPAANCIIEVNASAWRHPLQRLGRIMRFCERKKKEAYYYKIITQGSEEEKNHLHLKASLLEANVHFIRWQIDDPLEDLKAFI